MFLAFFKQCGQFKTSNFFRSELPHMLVIICRDPTTESGIYTTLYTYQRRQGYIIFYQISDFSHIHVYVFFIFFPEFIPTYSAFTCLHPFLLQFPCLSFIFFLLFSLKLSFFTSFFFFYLFPSVSLIFLYFL